MFFVGKIKIAIWPEIRFAMPSQVNCDDPELRGEAGKYMMEIEYVPGEECLKVLHHLFSQPENIVKEFSKYSGS